MGQEAVGLEGLGVDFVEARDAVIPLEEGGGAADALDRVLA